MPLISNDVKPSKPIRSSRVPSCIFAGTVATRLSNDHVLSIRTSTNVLDLQPMAQERLDELDVLLGILRQLLPLRRPARRRLPARQRLVNNLHLLQDIKARGEGIKLLSVVLVRHGDLELVKVVEDVKLGQVQRRVVVDLVGVRDHHSVEPSGTAPTAGGNTPLTALLLELHTKLVELLGWEWPAANTGSVGLYDADNLLQRSPSEGQTGQDSSQAGVGAGDVRVGSVVNIQHDGVCALDKDAGLALLGGLQEWDLVNDKGSELLAVFLERRDFSLWVILEQVSVALLEAGSYAAELGLEQLLIEDLADTDTAPGHLCAVCWPNTYVMLVFLFGIAAAATTYPFRLCQSSLR